MSIYFKKTFQRAFGTFPLRDDALAKALTTAVDVGFRAIDTAQMYGNEADVGAALTALSVPRDELCITTKVHPDNFSENAFLSSVENSLKDLRLDYVDVLLLHWPPADGDTTVSLRLLEQAQQRGLARNVGISNYTAQMMRDAQKAVAVPLVTNQVEFHPLLNQDVLLGAAKETGIPLSSYCSVARGEIFKHDVFARIGSVYGKTPAQVAQRWIMQKGVSVNTMSTNPGNIRANFEIVDFELSAAHMSEIDGMTAMNYRIVTKERVPWAPHWD